MKKVPIPIKRKRARVHHRAGMARGFNLSCSQRVNNHRTATAAAATARQKDREFFAFLTQHRPNWTGKNAYKTLGRRRRGENDHFVAAVEPRSGKIMECKMSVPPLL